MTKEAHKSLTMEDLANLKEHADTTKYEALRFTGTYLDPKTISKAVTDIEMKLRFHEMGMEKMSDSDVLLLHLINAQKGFLF